MKIYIDVQDEKNYVSGIGIALAEVIQKVIDFNSDNHARIKNSYKTGIQSIKSIANSAGQSVVEFEQYLKDAIKEDIQEIKQSILSPVMIVKNTILDIREIRINQNLFMESVAGELNKVYRKIDNINENMIDNSDNQTGKEILTNNLINEIKELKNLVVLQSREISELKTTRTAAQVINPSISAIKEVEKPTGKSIVMHTRTVNNKQDIDKLIKLGVADKDTIPILVNILYDNENKTLTSTNMDMTIQKLNYDIPGLKNGSITGSNPEDFPIPPVITGIELETKGIDINGILSHTVEYASDVYTRQVLNGVCVEYKHKTKKLCFTATDGRRLAHTEIDFEYNTNFQCIVPTKTIEKLLKFKDNWNIVLNDKENIIMFINNNWKITSRLIDGHFINYEQIIPKYENNTSFVGVFNPDKEEFKKIKKFTSEKYNSVEIVFKDNVLVCNCPDKGELRINNIFTDIEDREESLIPTIENIRLNPVFLSLVIGKKMRFNTNEKPIIVEYDKNTVDVLMPNRV